MTEPVGNLEMSSMDDEWLQAWVDAIRRRVPPNQRTLAAMLAQSPTKPQPFVQLS